MAGQDDLFESSLEDRLRRQAPLAARMRPTTLDEVVGQEHLLAPGRPLRALIDADRVSSIILWGPPGTGVGAPVSGSRPDWVLGKAMTSRMFSSPASSATRRSMPKAKPAWGGAP